VDELTEHFGALRPVVAVPTLVDYVAEMLRSSIFHGNFAPGERLVEADLARELRVSRGPIREALAVLTKEGIVANVPRRGKFVEDFTSAGIDEMYSLRRVLEPYAVRLVVRNLTDESMTRLNEAVRDIGTAVAQGDHTAVARRDIAFHDLLYTLARHRLLQRVWIDNIAGKLRLWLNVTHRNFSDAEESHRELVEPIFRKDTKTAQRRLEAHIDAAWEQAKEAFQRFGDVRDRASYVSADGVAGPPD
jgi:DNA-binding GntR family transcriptional regulator